MGQCFLPESINVPDLNNEKPLERLVADISDLVDCFVQRQEQLRELEVKQCVALFKDGYNDIE